MTDLPLTMPKMSMTMEEGTMVSWLKQVGDPVKSGEPICEVATDKVDMEVESPFDGILAKIIAEVDEVVKVGEAIAFITTEADDLLGGLFDEPLPTVDDSTDSGTEETAVANGGEVPIAESKTGSDWPAAVPLARSLAVTRGIDLASVTPTGQWGTIRVVDVEAADRSAYRGDSSRAGSTTVAAPVDAPLVVDPVASRRRRTRIQTAKVMSASAAVPQFTAFIELDLSALSAIRKTELGGASWTAILVRAQAITLREHPHLNAYWSDQGPVPNEDIGIALAVDSPTGLLAPVLRNSDRIELTELADEIATVVNRARLGTVSASSLGGGTTVFSNLGGFGVESFNALLTPPQATALSVGAIRPKLLVLNSGAFGARLSCTVGVTIDHRVADGGDAARYLATLRQIVGDPSRFTRVSS